MPLFKLSRPKRILVLGFVLIVVLLAAAWYWRIHDARTEAAANMDAAADAKAARGLELTDGDILRLAVQELELGLEVSGNLKAAESAWIKAKASGELQGLSVREGDVVTAGQVIGRIDPIEAQTRLQQAQEQAKSAQGQLQIAQRSYQNNKALVDQGFISQTALENSSGSLASANANYRAALAAADLTRKGLNDTVLKSPLSGIVSQRLVQNAERVNVETRIIEVVNLRQLELEAALSTAESLQVKTGQLAQIRVEGLPQPVLAKVERINPSAQAGSRSILVYLSVPNPDNNLRQGMFAQGRLQTQSMESLAVPESAIRLDKPRPYVQVVQNGEVKHHIVAVGAKGFMKNAATNPNQRWVAIAVELGTVPLQTGAVLLSGVVGALPEGTKVILPAPH